MGEGGFSSLIITLTVFSDYACEKLTRDVLYFPDGSHREPTVLSHCSSNPSEPTHQGKLQVLIFSYQISWDSVSGTDFGLGTRYREVLGQKLQRVKCQIRNWNSLFIYVFVEGSIIMSFSFTFRAHSLIFQRTHRS